MADVETVPRRGRGRPRGFDVDAALGRAAEVFWRLGYEGATLNDLTSAMGISPQSFYAAFGSKEEAYYRALEWYRASSEAKPPNPDSPDVVGEIETMLLRLAEAFTRRGHPRGCMISTGAMHVGKDVSDVAAHLTGLRDLRRESFQAQLDAGVAAGVLRPDVDTRALARFVAVVVQGMSVQAQDGASRAELRAVAALASAQVRAAASL